MQFPIYHAALSLKGKPPEELPHGLLLVPPEVKQLVEEERAKCSPAAFTNGPRGQRWMLNYWTVDFYFEGLGHEVIYRETPEGPAVLAVGCQEVFAFQKARSPDEPRDYEIYVDY